MKKTTQAGVHATSAPPPEIRDISSLDSIESRRPASRNLRLGCHLQPPYAASRGLLLLRFIIITLRVASRPFLFPSPLCSMSGKSAHQTTRSYTRSLSLSLSHSLGQSINCEFAISCPATHSCCLGIFVFNFAKHLVPGLHGWLQLTAVQDRPMSACMDCMGRGPSGAYKHQYFGQTWEGRLRVYANMKALDPLSTTPADSITNDDAARTQLVLVCPQVPGCSGLNFELCPSESYFGYQRAQT